MNSLNKYLLFIINRVLNVVYNTKYKINRKVEKYLLKDKNIEIEFSTSTSDTNEFRNINEILSLNEKYFKKFRQSWHYSKILEHVDFKTGNLYLREIETLDLDIDLKTNLMFKTKIESGKPFRFFYKDLGLRSPSTLRYLKIYLEIKTLFPYLKLDQIVEIGGGYGGQAKIFALGEDFSSYTIIDLPEAINLQKRYLDKIEKIKYIDNLEASNENYKANFQYDLCISNFAFSEINKRIQKIYLDKFILKSKCGYMIYNEINPPNYSYKATEIINMIPNSIQRKESPLTDKNNCLITWSN